MAKQIAKSRKKAITYITCTKGPISYEVSQINFKEIDILMGVVCDNNGSGVIMNIRNITSHIRLETRITSDKYVEISLYNSIYEHCKYTLRSSKQIVDKLNVIMIHLKNINEDQMQKN